ncbi:MAG: helix-turn-helix transcriptional regulator [Pseudomonadales bacterium]|nr:helix-turn-helix transcriptional regulator [Pseudomonadales bacterium]
MGKTIGVSDHLNRQSSNLKVMAERYGLTVAEREVVGLLAQGVSLADIAESTGRSRETVRSHLKAVFMKTGTHRQVELVVLVNGFTVTSI